MDAAATLLDDATVLVAGYRLPFPDARDSGRPMKAIGGLSAEDQETLSGVLERFVRSLGRND